VQESIQCLQKQGQ